MKLLISWLVIGFLALSDSYGAALDATSEQSFLLAQHTFEDGLAGKEAAVEPAIEAFTSLSKQNPDNPLYSAYLGSAMALRGRDAFFPWNKVKRTEEGLDLLDKALRNINPQHYEMTMRRVPVALEVQLVAGDTFISLPDFFNRNQAGAALIKGILVHPLYATSPPEFRAAVTLRVAKMAKQKDDAVAYKLALREVIELDSQGRYGAQAQQLLDAAQL